jgi:hypothetical protein
VAELLFVNHIGFGKNRATPGDAYRMLRFQSQFTEILDGDTEPCRLLVQK